VLKLNQVATGPGEYKNRSIWEPLSCMDRAGEKCDSTRICFFGQMQSGKSSEQMIFHWFFLYFVCVCVCVYFVYLCRPSEASTQYCAIPDGNPPTGRQGLLCVGEESDFNLGLLIRGQVCYC
jgi:hypothetical protein